MKLALILLSLLLLSILSQATSTDGNYTLLQHSFEASGADSGDGNYTAFLSVAEPVQGERMTDDTNYSVGPGFLGEPLYLIQIVVEVVVEVAINVSYIVMAMPGIGLSWLALIVGVIAVAGLLIYYKVKEEW